MSPNDPNPTPWHQRRLWQITPVRDAFWIVLTAGAAAFLLWFGYELRAIFTPVLIALALAYLFHPLIAACEKRWNIPRPVTIAAIIAMTAAAVLILGAWIGPKLIGQMKDLAGAVPGYLERLSKQWGIELDEKAKQIVAEVSKNPMAYLADKAAAILGGTGVAVNLISHVIGRLVLITITLALIPVYFFFFAWQFGPLVGHFDQYIPRSRRDRTRAILRRMDTIVAAYFRCRVAIALIMGVLFSIGWAMAGVPYPLLLGMGTGLLSIVPYASTLGWPLAVGLTWLDITADPSAAFDPWAVLVWPSGVYLVVQAVESWLLTPWIQGKSLDMSAVTILIVMFIGGAVGGLYGLLLCIPLAACIKVLMVELALPRIRAWAAEN